MSKPKTDSESLYFHCDEFWTGAGKEEACPKCKEETKPCGTMETVTKP